jgi:apolipoprotein D and lipocalin family protein
MTASDVDARVLQVEERLIAREVRLRRGLAGIGLRMRRGLRPWRRGLPAIGVALALSSLGALAWLWWQRRAPHGAVGGPTGAHHAGDAAAAQGGGIPWVRLVALGWPMLPASWRARVSPSMASSLVALGLPAAEWLLHGRRVPPPATMPSVDLARFAGDWCVLAQLPRHRARTGRDTRLRYTPRADGHFDVLASGHGGFEGGANAPGLAQIVPGSGGARLALSRWPAWLRALPWAWSDHWILHVDADYTEALVGDARRERLWLLSRRPQLPPSRLTALLQLARERGFAVERLRVASDG